MNKKKLWDAYLKGIEQTSIDMDMISETKKFTQLVWKYKPFRRRQSMLSIYYGRGMFAHPGGYEAMGFDDHVDELEYSSATMDELKYLLRDAWAIEKHDFKGDIDNIPNMSFKKIKIGKTIAWGKTITNIVKLNNDWCSLEIYTGSPY